MITYVYTIDKYNKIVMHDDGAIESLCDMFDHMEDMGWGLKYQDWEIEDQRLARKRLASIFHTRNFYLWEHMKERRGLI